MSNDVFGRESEGFGGAFDSSSAVMTIDEISDLLVTNVSVQYQQNLNRVFDIQSDKVYFVVGRTQGSGSLGTVIGPKGASSAGISKLSDICNPALIEFDFTGAGCTETGANTNISFKRVITDVTLQSVGFTLQAADMMINENLGIQFGQLLNG
jgi:hypothetical protein